MNTIDPYLQQATSAVLYLNQHYDDGTATPGTRGYALVTKPQEEFRGHSFTTEVRRPGTPQERSTTRWFYQGAATDNGGPDCTPTASGNSMAAYEADGCFVALRTSEFLRGKVYRTEVAEAGRGLISRTAHTYAVDFDPTTDYGPAAYVGGWHAWTRETGRTETYFEGQGSGTQRREAYDYGPYGNRTATREYDQSDALYRQLVREYHAPQVAGNTYLVARVARVETRNAGGVALARTEWPTYRATCSGGSTGDPAEVRAYADLGAGVYTRTTYGYDCWGNRTDVTTWKDGQPRTTTTQYDGAFKAYPTLVTLPSVNGLALTEGAEYDTRMGTLTKVTDPNGVETRATYDPFGRLAKVWNPDDSETQPTLLLDYHNYGSPTDPARFAAWRRVTSGSAAPAALRPLWRYYDGRGRAVQERRYGANGQFLETNTLYKDTTGVVKAGQPHAVATSDAFVPIVEGDAANRWTTSETDGVGRTIRVTLPDGSASTADYARTAGGGLVRTADANGHVTEGETDVWGRATATREFTGVFPNVTPYATTTVEYDPLNRATKTRDAQLIETSTTYDALGRVLTVSDPDRGLSTRTYDAVGNLKVASDARGKTVMYTYDALDRLTGTSGDLVSNYVYDTDPANPAQPSTKGRLTTTYTGSTTAPTVKARSVYDRRGRVTRGEQTILGVTAASDATYDDAGQVTAATLPGGEVVTYRYDLDGSPLTARSSLAGQVYYLGGATGTDTTYNARGQLTGRVFGNGLIEGRTYDDALGRLVRGQLGTAAPTPAAPADRSDRSYTYDPVGNVRTQAESTTGETQSYAYDARDRLTHAFSNRAASSPGAYDETYAYDPVGNFTSKAGVAYDYSDPPLGSGQTRPKHAPKSVGGEAYTYDAVGNVLTGGGRTIEWNAQGLPAKVSGVGGPGQPAPTPVPGTTPALTNNRGGATVPGVPNLTSNRVAGTTTPGALNLTAPNRPGGTGSTAVEETYTYDAGDSRVTRTHDGITTRYFGSYEEDSDGTKRWLYSFGGSVVAQREKKMGQSGDGTVVYLHGDHLGSVSVVTDASKAIVSRTEYDPWGKPRTSSTGAKPTTLDFTGQRKDGTGLLYYGARYYDPQLGRFLRADTVRDGVNPYAYVHNNPLNFTDPTGHMSVEETAQAVAAGAAEAANHVTSQGNEHYTSEQLQEILNTVKLGIGGEDPGPITCDENCSVQISPYYRGPPTSTPVPGTCRDFCPVPIPTIAPATATPAMKPNECGMGGNASGSCIMPTATMTPPTATTMPSGIVTSMGGFVGPPAPNALGDPYPVVYDINGNLVPYPGGVPGQRTLPEDRTQRDSTATTQYQRAWEAAHGGMPPPGGWGSSMGEWQVHHILPLAYGGTNNPSNLVAVPAGNGPGLHQQLTNWWQNQRNEWQIYP